MARHTQHNVIYPLSTLIFRSVEMNSSCLRYMCVYYAILLYYSMLLWTLLNSLYGIAISYAFYIKHNSHNAHIIHSLAACLFVWHAPSHIATSTNVLFIHVCALCVCVLWYVRSAILADRPKNWVLYPSFSYTTYIYNSGIRLPILWLSINDLHFLSFRRLCFVCTLATLIEIYMRWSL